MQLKKGLIELYLEFFRGNINCYAVRWQNKQGRSGYSLACDNEWKRGLCNKPKVKCLECSHQSFKPLDSRAIYDHLSGSFTVGIYPMDADSHCWFLAIDFDKSDWKEASLAYAEACKRNGIDYLLERSRSENGAHVWIFLKRRLMLQEQGNLVLYFWIRLCKFMEPYLLILMIDYSLTKTIYL